MKSPIRTLIVEDEPLAREGMLMFAKDVDFLEVTGVCEDALQANTVLAGGSIDLMFLDIQMPRMTGIDFLKTLQNPPMVIITTAYPNFALEGYELNVLDYLVKPFPFSRFLKAVNKANDFYSLKNRRQDEPALKEDYFFVKCDYKYEKIRYDEVLYVEGMENYVIIYTRSQKYITMLRMKSMEEILPSSFVRIHKSFIASLGAISSVDGNEVVIGDKKLPLSREKKAEILSRLIKN